MKLFKNKCTIGSIFRCMFYGVMSSCGDRRIRTSSRNQKVLSIVGYGRLVSVDAKCILISGLKRNTHLQLWDANFEWAFLAHVALRPV